MIEPIRYQKAARDLSYALVKQIADSTGETLNEEQRQKFEAWVEPLLEQFEFEVIARVENEDGWECDGDCDTATDLRCEIADLESDKGWMEARIYALESQLEEMNSREFNAD